GSELTPRHLVHILDYLAQDYGVAVSSKGKIINAAEYDEQIEFSNETLKIAKKIGISASIETQLESLRKKVVAKEQPETIKQIALHIKQQVIKEKSIPQTPRHWPDLELGKKLYAQNCVSCHGATWLGDGPGGKTLDPKPSNFMDDSRM